MNDGPLSVQSDKTILLGVGHGQAAEARHAIAAFAALERAGAHAQLPDYTAWAVECAGRRDRHRTGSGHLAELFALSGATPLTH